MYIFLTSIKTNQIFGYRSFVAVGGFGNKMAPFKSFAIGPSSKFILGPIVITKHERVWFGFGLVRLEERHPSQNRNHFARLAFE